jgi:hypothetical protein
MKGLSFTRHLLAIVVITMCGAPAASSADIPADLNANEVVRRMVQRNQERAQDLQAFTGDRRYRLEYRGFPSQRSAELDVKTSYRAPGEKQYRVISQSGSQLIIERVFKKLLEGEIDAAGRGNQQRTELTPENYKFLLIGTDVIAGRNQYVFSVTPRSENKYLYRGKVWVDANDFAVVQIEAQPARNPSFWTVHTDIQHLYVKIGEFWLPSHNTSVTKVRFGGTATLTIDYFNYKIGAATATSW